MMTTEIPPITPPVGRCAQLNAAKAMQRSAADHNRLAILSNILATHQRHPMSTWKGPPAIG